mmetsp:Transcript_162796/g.521835  ORF Transcript_162796/g.521835 Transcript_162796/m.521835 type:complete len:575 (+) Transcript_162796:92-1816(+)
MVALRCSFWISGLMLGCAQEAWADGIDHSTAPPAVEVVVLRSAPRLRAAAATAGRRLQLVNPDATFVIGFEGEAWITDPAAVIVKGELVTEGSAPASMDILILRRPWEYAIERKTGALCNIKQIKTDVAAAASGSQHQKITVEYELLPRFATGFDTQTFMKDPVRLDAELLTMFKEEVSKLSVDFDPTGWVINDASDARAALGVVVHPGSFRPAYDLTPVMTTTVTRTVTAAVPGATQAPAGPCKYSCPEVDWITFKDNELTLSFCEEIKLRSGKHLVLEGTRANHRSVSMQVPLAPLKAEIRNDTGYLIVDLAGYLEPGLQFTVALPIGTVEGRARENCMAWSSQQFEVSASGGSSGPTAQEEQQANMKLMLTSEAQMAEKENILRGALVAGAALIFCCCWCAAVYVIRQAMFGDDEDEDESGKDGRVIRRSNSLKQAGRTLRRTLSPKGRSSSRSSKSAQVYPFEEAAAPADGEKPSVGDDIGAKAWLPQSADGASNATTATANAQAAAAEEPIAVVSVSTEGGGPWRPSGSASPPSGASPRSSAHPSVQPRRRLPASCMRLPACLRRVPPV